MSEFLSSDSSFNPQGLSLGEVPHILIPGRGRQNHGMDLTPQGLDRVDTAASLYFSGEMSHEQGFVIPCGYKTPAERDSKGWHDPISGRWLEGIPEATLMTQALQKLGVRRSVISAETTSVDTVTNLVHAEAESHFGLHDERPVAIVAQEGHLDRIIKVIAPKTLRRDFIGIVVAEDSSSGDSRAARLFSHIVLRGITPDIPDIKQVADVRVKQLWDIVLKASDIKSRIVGSKALSHSLQDGSEGQ